MCPNVMLNMNGVAHPLLWPNLSTSKAAGAFSRTSVGLDLAAAMLGSEGCLGIITSVVVKVVPLPAVSEHASFLFKDFQVTSII